MILKNGICFVNGEFIKADVEIENGLITNISENIGGADYVNCINKYIIPGYVDIHTHGCCGYDFSSASSEEIGCMLRKYAQNGTTSLLATTVSLSEDAVETATNNINNAHSEGAQVLGINLEGPFLSPKKRGAHDENVLCKPDIAFVEKLENIREVCLAPELNGAEEFIKQFDGICSVAHTDCDYDTAINAFNLGANHITHLFNAMNGMHHRNPGVVGAFCESDAIAEMICDGIHVNETIIRIMFRLAGDRIAIISDSMAACGLCDGKYKLGNLDVTVVNSVATLSDGTIAGSTVFVSEMVRRLISFGIKPESAIRSATQIPADSIGEKAKGRISVGAHADILVCDRDLNIENVYIAGRLV